MSNYKAGDKQRAALGRDHALKLVIESELTTGEMVQALVEKFECSASSAKRWIKHARTTGLKEAAAIDTTDLDSSRWHRVLLYDKRSRIYRKLADGHLNSTPTLENTTPQRSALQFEKYAIEYGDRVDKLLWLDKIPPDRDLSEPEQLETVLNAIIRALPKVPRGKLIELKLACVEQLERNQRDPATSPDQQEYESEKSITEETDADLDSVL